MTATNQAQTVTEEIEAAYTARTPASRASFARAARALPDGDTRNSAYFRPYPLFLSSGRGARLTDVDGNTYLDWNSNWTSLIHGHGRPEVVRAATSQIENGTAWAAANPHTPELADLIVRRVPGVDRVRFCNSGTEATMMAVRAARAATGRRMIIKMRAAYHGSADLFQVANGKVGVGIDPDVVTHSIEIPFNDKAAASAALAAHAHETAALIVEGLMGSAGMLAPEDDYLQHLRAETSRHGVLLVFDEVISLRLAAGGAQQLYGVTPDLTALGKIIGGGFPVGAFGGREELMMQFSPLRDGYVGHSGTFNANPVTMAAGVATLKALPQAEIDRINALGDRFAEGALAAAAERGIRLQITGYGSLRNLHFATERVRDGATANAADHELVRLLHLALLPRGVFASGRGMFVTSTAITEADVDETVAALDDALRQLLPAIEERMPALLG